jgi:SSS family solute:Na+ symporter
VLHVILGSNLLLGALVSALVVLAYVLLGGIRATIYTSIFQFFVVIAGLFPLLIATFPFKLTSFAERPEEWHLWQPLPLFAPHASLDRLGVAVGLGFVISFSYWCTDFVVVQRALTARGVEEARKVPILAGFGKLAIAFLIVLPGAAAPMLLNGLHAASHDETMPALLALVYGPTLLGLGVAALLSGLMAGFAGNVSGFAAAWTQEIYRAGIRPDRPEQHYIRMGRWAVVMCFLLAGLAAYLAAQFRDLMEFLQLVLSLFYAPLLAAVLAGVFRKRARERDALAGILLGVMTGITLEACVHLGAIHFGSQMSANFYIAILSFTVSMLVTSRVDGLTLQRQVAQAEFPVIKPNPVPLLRPTLITGALSALLLAACLVLNLVWW